MDPSTVKALWDGLTPEQKKAMATIAADGQAASQPKVVQMEDASDDEPVTLSSSSVAPSSSSTAPSSSAPPSPVHCTMTIGEACAHYMDMVRQEQSREAQAEANYNHNLLQEHP